MNQHIIAVLNRLKSTVINDDVLEDDYNSGYESWDNNEADISAKTILDIIVKKKNIPDLKIIK